MGDRYTVGLDNDEVFTTLVAIQDALFYQQTEKNEPWRDEYILRLEKLRAKLRGIKDGRDSQGTG